MPAAPIPAAVWARIQRFLADGRNGQIAPDQQFYACKCGEIATLAVGDLVSAIRHGAGYVVLGAIDS